MLCVAMSASIALRCPSGSTWFTCAALVPEDVHRSLGRWRRSVTFSKSSSSRATARNRGGIFVSPRNSSSSRAMRPLQVVGERGEPRAGVYASISCTCRRGCGEHERAKPGTRSTTAASPRSRRRPRATCAKPWGSRRSDERQRLRGRPRAGEHVAHRLGHWLPSCAAARPPCAPWITIATRLRCSCLTRSR